MRTVKPETFDDPDLNALSPLARWLFVGLWTQADRDGRLECDPRVLKVRLLPYDKVAVDVLLEELSPKFITRYTVDGKNYLQVNNFPEHQRPHPSEKACGFPAPAVKLQDEPGNLTAKTLGMDHGSGNGYGNRNGEGKDAAQAASPSGLVALWNETTHPPIARCLELTAKRRVAAKARLAERPLTEWAEVVTRIQASGFCRGQNDTAWVASFDWLLKPDTATKVLEGKYDNRPTTTGKRSPPVDAETRRYAERFAAIAQLKGES